MTDPLARLGKYLSGKPDSQGLKLVDSPAQLGEMTMKRIEEFPVLLVPGRTNEPVGCLKQGLTSWERVPESEPDFLHSMSGGLPALRERK